MHIVLFLIISSVLFFVFLPFTLLLFFIYLGTYVTYLIYFLINILYFIFFKKNVDEIVYRYTENSFEDFKLNLFKAFILNSIILNSRRYAFLFVYVFLKFCFIRPNFFNIELILNLLKKLLIRYLIIIITGLPYLFLKKNFEFFVCCYSVLNAIIFIDNYHTKSLIEKIKLFIELLFTNLIIQWDFNYIKLNTNFAIIKNKNNIKFNPKTDDPKSLSGLLKKWLLKPTTLNEFNLSKNFIHVNIYNELNKTHHNGVTFINKDLDKIYFVNETTKPFLPKELFFELDKNKLETTSANKNIYIGEGSFLKEKKSFSTPIQSVSKDNKIIKFDTIKLTSQKTLIDDLYIRDRLKYSFIYQNANPLLNYDDLENKIKILDTSFYDELKTKDLVTKNYSFKNLLEIIEVSNKIKEKNFNFRSLSQEEKLQYFENLNLTSSEKETFITFFNNITKD